MLQPKRKIKMKTHYLPFRAKENKNENTILALLRCRFSIYFESKHSFYLVKAMLSAVSFGIVSLPIFRFVFLIFKLLWVK